VLVMRCTRHVRDVDGLLRARARARGFACLRVQADRNGDGQLSFDEFQQWYAAPKNQMMFPTGESRCAVRWVVVVTEPVVVVPGSRCCSQRGCVGAPVRSAVWLTVVICQSFVDSVTRALVARVA
jgi:hypothetical protein